MRRKPSTLAEYATRSWKANHGDKTYEQVEQEYEERRRLQADKILANLPYKKPGGRIMIFLRATALCALAFASYIYVLSIQGKGALNSVDACLIIYALMNLACTTWPSLIGKKPVKGDQ